MIKKMLIPLLKKYIGIFISMILVSIFSISLLSGEASSIYNLDKSYKDYKKEYKTMDIMISTDPFNREDVRLDNIDGVDEYIFRYSLDLYLGYQKNDNERIIYSRIFTYSDGDSLLKKYSYGKGDYDLNYLNISMSKKYANFNNLKLNDHINFYINDLIIPANIYEIVDAPETIFVQSNKYIWQDNMDFGYVYVENLELFRIYNIYKDDIPEDVISTSLNANQILLTVKDGYKIDDVKNNIESYLNDKGIIIKDSIKEDESSYDVYIHSCIKQIKTSSIFLPIFFFIVSLVIILLFMNQIIKSMTKEIAIMISIGIKRIEIYGLFSIFILINSIISAIIGNLIAIIITRVTTKIFIDIYSFPTIIRSLNFNYVLLSIISIIIVGQLACFISCRKILKMNVCKAMTNNRTINNKESKLVKKITKNRNINFSLAINSIFKNKKRFFVSLFSTFATISIVLAALQLNSSIDSLIYHTVDERLTYDCQIYTNKIYDDSFIEDISSKDFIDDIEVCYFTYAKVEANNKEYYLKTLAVKEDNNLIFIPNNDNKKTNVKEEGIILTFNDAKNLGVKKGDIVIINNKEIKVIDISRQYFNMTQYMSLKQMEDLDITYTSNLIVNTNNEDELLNYLAHNEKDSLAVFSSSLNKSINRPYKPVKYTVLTLIIFSLLISLSILSILAINQLNDDKKNISIMRMIGFRIKDISIYWLIQDLIFILISIIFAIPFTLLLTKILLDYVSSNRQIYPFEIDIKIVLFSVLFTVGVILISHIISMIKINKWNLADNTRSKD